MSSGSRAPLADGIIGSGRPERPVEHFDDVVGGFAGCRWAVALDILPGAFEQVRDRGINPPETGRTALAPPASAPARTQPAPLVQPAPPSPGRIRHRRDRTLGHLPEQPQASAAGGHRRTQPPHVRRNRGQIGVVLPEAQRLPADRPEQRNARVLADYLIRQLDLSRGNAEEIVSPERRVTLHIGNRLQDRRQAALNGQRGARTGQRARPEPIL